MVSKPTEIEKTQRYIRWVACLVASLVLIYMSYISMRMNFTLETPVILGMIALIVLLMFGVESLERLIETWKGG